MLAQRPPLSVHPSIHPPPHSTSSFTRFFSCSDSLLARRETFYILILYNFCPYNKNNVYWRLCVCDSVGISAAMGGGSVSNPIHLDWFTFSAVCLRTVSCVYYILVKCLRVAVGRGNNFLVVLKIKHQEN